MLYRGIGSGNFWPNVPLLDLELDKGIARRGFSGSRARARGVFTSTLIEQAKEYAETEADLFEAIPLPGSIVTFIDGSKDLVLEFETWLRWRSCSAEDTRSMRSFLSDVQSDIGIVEAYLGFNRQTRNVDSLVDEFLKSKQIRECFVAEEINIAAFLNGHEGEVWITGPVALEKHYQPTMTF